MGEAENLKRSQKIAHSYLLWRGNGEEQTRADHSLAGGLRNARKISLFVLSFFVFPRVYWYAAEQQRSGERAHCSGVPLHVFNIRLSRKLLKCSAKCSEDGDLFRQASLFNEGIEEFRNSTYTGNRMFVMNRLHQCIELINEGFGGTGGIVGTNSMEPRRQSCKEWSNGIGSSTTPVKPSQATITDQVKSQNKPR